MQLRLPRLLRAERLILLFIILLALMLRLWALGAKGLSYDEAATALMAQASGPDIVRFHWTAAFEHPPLWQLTMHAWTGLFGQSEAMLRLLPALVGVAAVPLTWYWVRLMWPERTALRLVAAALVAISPTLVIYSQEARMYTIVVLLALLSLCLLVELVHRTLVQRPAFGVAALFAVVNWLMTGYHYYSLLLIASEALFLLVLALRLRAWRSLAWWLGACAASVIPIALWMLLAPGFHDTFTAITSGIGKGSAEPALDFADGLWRDLAFGSFRWQPPTDIWAYVLIPLLLIGLIWLLLPGRSGKTEPWGWLVAVATLLPLLVSIVLFRTLAARYVLFLLPALYVLVAAGIVWLGARYWLLGALGLGLVAAVAVLSFGYYYGPYAKSEYREMAAYLQAHAAPQDAIMLYAPRQHLLAKYYLGSDIPYATAPQVELPAYWPVNAPHVVPEQMDGQIQALLKAHPAVWLVMTAQNEVDLGEFVPKYFTAVSYKQDCWQWIDVDLCRFASPHFADQAGPVQTAAPNVLYNGDLRLERTSARLLDNPKLDQRYILAELDWLAERKPTLDYRVTVRLVDQAGQVVAQRDDFPIGALLPPTTWNAGDAKPGYVALPVARNQPPGAYRLTVGVYNPANGAPIGETVEIARFDLP